MVIFSAWGGGGLDRIDWLRAGVSEVNFLCSTENSGKNEGQLQLHWDGDIQRVRVHPVTEGGGVEDGQRLTWVKYDV